MRLLRMIEDASDKQLREAINLYVQDFASPKTARDIKECLNRQKVKTPPISNGSAKMGEILLPFDIPLSVKMAKRILNYPDVIDAADIIIRNACYDGGRFTAGQIIQSLPRDRFEFMMPKYNVSNNVPKSLVGVILKAGAMVQRTGKAKLQSRNGRFWMPKKATKSWSIEARVAHTQKVLDSLPFLIKEETGEDVRIKEDESYGSII